MAQNCNIQNKPKTVKEFFSSWYFWKPFLASGFGIIAGLLYYYFIGCTTGSCGVASSPVGSAILGGMFGLFVVNSPCAGGCN